MVTKQANQPLPKNGGTQFLGSVCVRECMIVVLLNVLGVDVTVTFPWKTCIPLLRISHNKLFYLLYISASCDPEYVVDLPNSSCEEYYFLKDFIYSFQREGKGGRRRGRETLMCERQTSISCLSYMPQAWTEPAAKACALTREQTGNLSLCGTMPSQLSHTSQG